MQELKHYRQLFDGVQLPAQTLADIERAQKLEVELNRQTRSLLLKLYYQQAPFAVHTEGVQEGLCLRYCLLHCKVETVFLPAQAQPTDQLDTREQMLRELMRKSAEARKQPQPARPLADEPPVKRELPEILTQHFDFSSASDLFGRKPPKRPNRLISSLKAGPEEVAVCGKAFAYEEKPLKTGKIAVTFGIYDYTASITVKLMAEESDIMPLRKAIEKPRKNGYPVAVLVRGRVVDDDFLKCLCIKPVGISSISQRQRMDEAPKKRVELHLHTKMSATDGMIDTRDVVRLAHRWGMKAIAVTDHGVLQAFPEVALELGNLKRDYKDKVKAAEKEREEALQAEDEAALAEAEAKLVKAKQSMADLPKIIYGVEGYYVDDSSKIVMGTDESELSDAQFIVFDTETTGLNAGTDAITEIAAYRVVDGEITDSFSTYVNPQRHIPENITQLTGISDETVAGAPSIEEVLPRFMEFCGNGILVAHNAPFDMGFLKAAGEKMGIEIPNTYIDTVALARFLLPELKNHKLNNLADHFHLSFEHHRATEDTKVLAEIFNRLISELKSRGAKTVTDIKHLAGETGDPKKGRSHHIILLVKNKVGLKNLYKLVSEAHINYFYKHPRIPRSRLVALREGLIIGSACEAGELYRAVQKGAPWRDLCEIAKFYDYLEIQPLGNNQFMVDEGVATHEKLIENNKTIVRLAETLKIPVVATCDAHFLDPEDGLFRRIILCGQKFSDGDREIPLFVRTTEEMLEEFSYLGKEKAYEAVVEAPNRIADMIEVFDPIPQQPCPPSIDGAEEQLQQIVWGRAKAVYGDPVPKIVADRLEKELYHIIKNNFAIMYMSAQKLVARSEEEGYLVGSRGSVGSSFVATMGGISEVNPLPPHYVCPQCRHSEFVLDGSVGSGFDLADKNCPQCGHAYRKDGHDIPFETFLGFDGDKTPDIDLNFSGEVQAIAHKYCEVLFGADNVFRAGTISCIQDKVAYGYVRNYLESHGGENAHPAEINRLIDGCSGAKKTTGQHPGGIVVVPRDRDVYDFTPVQRPADKEEADNVTTHFAFTYLHDTLLKLDILGHDVPTKYKYLQDLTGVDILSVPMDDPKVLELFASTKSIGVTPQSINSGVATFGLPEMGTKLVRQMLMDVKPKSFTDLIQVSGFSHGTGVWHGNAQDLIESGTCDTSQVIGTRDSIMLYLCGKGLPNKLSFSIMESVRKGKGLKPDWEVAMRENNVEEWYIESCKKIKYMFPKAHAAAYVISALRLGWFKVHYPKEFYCAYFSAQPDGFDATIALAGKKRVEAEISRIENTPGKASQKDAASLKALELVNELLARNIQLLPIDLYRSGAKKFRVEGDAIRLPFNTLPGLGDAAAEALEAEGQNGEYRTVEELVDRTGVNKSTVEVLRAVGALDGLPETAQISLF